MGLMTSSSTVPFPSLCIVISDFDFIFIFTDIKHTAAYWLIAGLFACGTSMTSSVYVSWPEALIGRGNYVGKPSTNVKYTTYYVRQIHRCLPQSGHKTWLTTKWDDTKPDHITKIFANLDYTLYVKIVWQAIILFDYNEAIRRTAHTDNCGLSLQSHDLIDSNSEVIASAWNWNWK
jgi:hypothetical protein